MSEKLHPKDQTNSLTLTLPDSSFTQSFPANPTYSINTDNPSPTARSCPRCNSPNDKVSKFCSECGFKLIQDDPGTIQRTISKGNEGGINHTNGGFSVPSSPRVGNYTQGTYSAESSPIMNQMFWGDEYNSIRYPDEGYSQSYPISPQYYSSPTGGTPLSGSDFSELLTFDEWNYKRQRPSSFYTPLLSYPVDYPSYRSIYYNFIPEKNQMNIADYFTTLSSQEYNLLLSCYNISIVNEIKPEYANIISQEGCIYCLSVLEKPELYMVFQCLRLGCIHFMHLSCIALFLNNVQLLSEILSPHSPPIMPQPSTMSRTDRGLDGYQYICNSCYWEIDFCHLLGGSSSLIFAISDIPLYSSPRERGYTLYLENSRDLPELQKYIAICGRFIVHFYVHNTGYYNSFCACYDLSVCDRHDLSMTLCDPLSSTIITVTFYDQLHGSSLLLKSFKMTLPSISKTVTTPPTLQRVSISSDHYPPLAPSISPTNQNTIIKPIPINNTPIPLMTVSSITGAKTEYESICNRICELALTQSGSKSLQKLIDSTVNKPMLYDLVITECLTHFSSLMMNSFANYFVQTLFKNCTHAQQMSVLQDISPSLSVLIYDKIGTYALQNIIQQMKGSNDSGLLLMKTIQSSNLNIKTMIKDNKGTHIIQKLLKCFDPEVWGCLPPLIIQDSLEYCYDKNGSMVCRTCIDVSDIKFVQEFTASIKSDILKLSQHEMGNYVIQHLLFDRGDDSIPLIILESLKTHYSQLSNSKISSNVVEKCLMYNNDHYRDVVIDELFMPSALPGLISSKYGTYVIQKACSVVTNTASKQKLYRVLQPLIKQLSSTENVDVKWVGILEKLNETTK